MVVEERPREHPSRKLRVWKNAKTGAGAVLTLIGLGGLNNDEASAVGPNDFDRQAERNGLFDGLVAGNDGTIEVSDDRSSGSVRTWISTRT